MTPTISAEFNGSHNRDEILDVAKGLAIALVVLGHTIQNQNLEFDNSLAFRVIYSFHMPLFAFLSGAAASYWSTYLTSKNELSETILSSTARVFKSAKQLILPFIVWSIIAFYINHSQESPFDYFYKVAKNPDYGLWFLLCIFWCSTYICLLFPVILLLRKMMEGSKLEKYKEIIFSPITQFLFVLTIWSLLIKKLPGVFGIGYANSFHHGLFLYFVLGLFFFNIFQIQSKSLLRVIPYILFITLAPFWHRTLPNNLVLDAPSLLQTAWFSKNYAIIVCITGILVTLDISKFICSLSIKGPKRFASLLGISSLGVYAAHFYFLSYQPYFVSTILISLLLYQAILNVPILRTLLFGK